MEVLMWMCSWEGRRWVAKMVFFEVCLGRRGYHLLSFTYLKEHIY